MVGRTKAEAIRTKKTILDAAEKLFSQHGVIVSTLEHVACSAGVTRGAVYWHYRDKEELCAAIAERNAKTIRAITQELEDNLNEADPLARLEASYQKLLTFFLKKRQYLLLSFLPLAGEPIPGMEKLSQQHYKNIAALFSWNRRYMEHAKRLHVLSRNWTPEQAALSLEAFLVGLCIRSYAQKKAISADLATTNLHIFFNTLQQNS